jgi:aspartyl-tRNA(Asn)/glutamyl-tRNA(Gln) amidotransferase subunit A
MARTNAEAGMRASPDRLNAHSLAEQVRAGQLKAQDVAAAALRAIEARNGALNACAETYGAEALAAARRVDERVAADMEVGPLAGVPFLVKSNFDVAGHVTVAGSPARLARAAATDDAFAVAQLRLAGAILIGTTHMDELACGATGENPHFGAVCNPHDTARMTGGSSSGSAAAVAAGFVPLALGSDTNGSIRAPAALCGVWGVKPTFGRLSRSGCVPYADSLDVIGGFAREVDDLALLYEVLQGHDPRDPRQECVRARKPDAGEGDAAGLRVGILGGYFAAYADAEAQRTVQSAAAAFHDVRDIPFDVATVDVVRETALIVSNFEVAAAHSVLLDVPEHQCSPRLRSRLAAGAQYPAATYADALARQAAWRSELLALFAQCDILLAAATPYAAPRFDTRSIDVNGHVLEPAKTLGMLTQPISFAGLPVVTMPVADAASPLPRGVQVIAAPWREDRCFAAARRIAEHLAPR